MITKNIIVSFSILLIVFSFVTSCSLPKEPELKDIKNINITNFSISGVTVEADAILFNPNKIKAVLKEIYVTVWINDKEAGILKEESNIEVKGLEEFSVPLKLTFNPNKIFDNVLTGVMDVLSNKKLTVKYKGYIRVKISGVILKIPVSQKTDIKL